MYKRINTYATPLHHNRSGNSQSIGVERKSVCVYVHDREIDRYLADRLACQSRVDRLSKFCVAGGRIVGGISMKPQPERTSRVFKLNVPLSGRGAHMSRQVDQ